MTEPRRLSPAGNSSQGNQATTLARLEDFIGQDKTKAGVADLIVAARRRSEALDHLLFFGLTGLGKTTFAHIVANEMGTNMKVLPSTVFEKVGDFATTVTNLRAGDILLIPQMESIRRSVAEVLYRAMKDYSLEITIGKGLSARSITLKLPRFTVIGTTNRLTQMDQRIRSLAFEFGFGPYDTKEVREIILWWAKKWYISIDLDAADFIAAYCKGVPAQAVSLLKRVHRSAEVHTKGRINLMVAKYVVAGMGEIDDGTG